MNWRPFVPGNVVKSIYDTTRFTKEEPLFVKARVETGADPVFIIGWASGAEVFPLSEEWLFRKVGEISESLPVAPPWEGLLELLRMGRVMLSPALAYSAARVPDELAKAAPAVTRRGGEAPAWSTREDTISALEDALEFARRHLPKRKPGRFDTYLRVLKESLTEPDWDDDEPAKRLLLQASSQARQLASATRLLRTQSNPRVVVKKLKEVLAGGEMPAAFGGHDQPRDMLLELVAGDVLSRGFQVEVPFGNDEDLRLEVEGLPRILVECKRPQSRESVGSAIGEKHSQLVRRCQGDELGIIVIGVDRVSTPEGEGQAFTIPKRALVDPSVAGHLNQIVAPYIMRDSVDVLDLPRAVAILLVWCDTGFLIQEASTIDVFANTMYFLREETEQTQRIAAAWMGSSVR